MHREEQQRDPFPAPGRHRIDLPRENPCDPRVFFRRPEGVSRGPCLISRGVTSDTGRKLSGWRMAVQIIKTRTVCVDNGERRRKKGRVDSASGLQLLQVFATTDGA